MRVVVQNNRGGVGVNNAGVVGGAGGGALTGCVAFLCGVGIFSFRALNPPLPSLGSQLRDRQAQHRKEVACLCGCV